MINLFFPPERDSAQFQTEFQTAIVRTFEGEKRAKLRRHPVVIQKWDMLMTDAEANALSAAILHDPKDTVRIPFWHFSEKQSLNSRTLLYSSSLPAGITGVAFSVNGQWQYRPVTLQNGNLRFQAAPVDSTIDTVLFPVFTGQFNVTPIFEHARGLVKVTAELRFQDDTLFVSDAATLPQSPLSWFLAKLAVETMTERIDAPMDSVSSIQGYRVQRVKHAARRGFTVAFLFDRMASVQTVLSRTAGRFGSFLMPDFTRMFDVISAPAHIGPQSRLRPEKLTLGESAAPLSGKRLMALWRDCGAIGGGSLTAGVATGAELTVAGWDEGMPENARLHTVAPLIRVRLDTDAPVVIPHGNKWRMETALIEL